MNDEVLPVTRQVSDAFLNQIETLAIQIEHPTVEYCDDQVAMANDAISDQKRRATLIRSLVAKVLRP